MQIPRLWIRSLFLELSLIYTLTPRDLLMSLLTHTVLERVVAALVSTRVKSKPYHLVAT